MERHEFDAAYARICEGLRHEDADGAFRVSRHPPEFHLRRQAAHDDSAAWL